MQLHNLPAAFESPPGGEGIDLQHFWRIARQSWKGILGLSLVVGMLAALWVMRLPPIYRATTTIMIEAQTANTVSIEEVYGLPARNYQYFLTQFEIIRTRDIAKLTADALGLWDHPGFAPPQEGHSDEQRRNAVIDGIMGGLSVEPVQYTQLARIHFQSTDRELAAEIANTVAKMFIQSQLDAKMTSTREAGDWISSRLDDLKANLEASQKSLQDFRDQEEIIDVAGGQTLGVQELNDLNGRWGEARRALLQAENLFKGLDAAAGRSASEMMTMPGVLQHPLVQALAQSLTEAEQDVTKLRRRYGPEHPKMIAAIARVESVQEEFEDQVLQVRDAMEKEYQLARRNEENLRRQLEAAKQQVASLNRKEFRLHELEQQVETDQRLYEMFFSRARETSETIGFHPAQARVVETATVPMYPIAPDKRKFVLIAVILSALAGVALAILRDLLDNTLKTPDDVADRLHVPLLGALPNIKLPKRQKGPYTGFIDDQTSNFAEAVRTARTSLALSGLETPHKITVVTSTTPGEGKSTVAINLAAALAQMEKVLLVDADLRRPTAAAVFDIARDAPGLTEVMALSAELKAAIHTTAQGFDVLPVGVIPPNPQEMISSLQFKKMLSELAGQYDRVIIDSTPINAVSDSLILATQADSLVYVVKADATPATVVKRSLEHLKSNNLPFTGVILNRLDTRRQSYYSKDGYYSGYYSSTRGKA